MGKAVGYKIIKSSETLYQLSHGSFFLCEFSRQNVREILEAVASAYDFSSHWIGFVIRLLNKTFPMPYSVSVRSAFDRFVDKFGAEGVANYYRSKGFRIVKKVPFSDLEGIRYLEKEGYIADGFIGDVHYSTAQGAYAGK